MGISTYPRDLEKLDAVVTALKRRGDGRTSRSSVIRTAVDMYFHWLGLA